MSIINKTTLAFPPGIFGHPVGSNLIINLQDGTLGGGANGIWTLGSCLVLPFDEQPSLGEQWSLLGWSISYIGLVEYATAAGLRFGKLGQFWAGPLFRSSQPLTGTLAQPISKSPLPADQNVGKVWDAANDSLFPAMSAGSYGPPDPTLQTRTFSQQLPQTIDMASGDSLSFGIWLTPQLLQGVVLDIIDAQVSLTYTSQQLPANTR